MITNPSHQDDELQVETRSQRRRYLLHMGSWAPDSLKFMKDLGSRVTGEKHAKSFLFKSPSINLIFLDLPYA